MICVNLRLIFLFHVAIFDPPSSILDSHPSHSVLSTRNSVLTSASRLGAFEIGAVD